MFLNSHSLLILQHLVKIIGLSSERLWNAVLSYSWLLCLNFFYITAPYISKTYLKSLTLKQWFLNWNRWALFKGPRDLLYFLSYVLSSFFLELYTKFCTVFFISLFQTSKGVCQHVKEVKGVRQIKKSVRTTAIERHSYTIFNIFIVYLPCRAFYYYINTYRVVWFGNTGLFFLF